jgi:predicted Zn-dependent protease
MTSPIITNFEKMLAGGKDSALLRFSLGNEYLKAGDNATAAQHLEHAVKFDANYSAAWKLLGKALADLEQLPEALRAYNQGIEVADKRGDKQAAKEMTVFAKRIEKQLAETTPPSE